MGLLNDLFGGDQQTPLSPNSDIVPKALESAKENSKWKGTPNDEVAGKGIANAAEPAKWSVTNPNQDPNSMGGYGDTYGFTDAADTSLVRPLNFVWGNDPYADLRDRENLPLDTRTSYRPFDNKLEERGYLAFNYAFDPVANQKEQTTRVLPFFENPTITETRQANYAQTKIYLRNDTARLYTYTKPRKLTVNFHMTVPHVAEFFRGNGSWGWLLGKSQSAGGGTVKDLNEPQITEYLNRIVAWDVSLKKEIKDIPQSNAVSGVGGEKKLGQANINDFNEYQHNAVTFPGKKFHAVMDFLHYAVNHIRASVINSGGDRIAGPPICLLKFGSLYNNVPCIVKQYKLSVVETAGYETRTLFPNRIKVALTLEEMRGIHGNLHSDNSMIKGDLPGWQSLHRLGHIDPLPVDESD